MENNYETLRMPELKALAREHRLRNYSRLRKADLVAFLQNNEHQTRSMGEAQAKSRHRSPQMSPSGVPLRGATWEPQRESQTEARQPELEAGFLGTPLRIPLTKRQLKRRRNKDSKLAKEFISLDAEIDNLKSQMGTLKDKITKASESTNARFKRKKIRFMKREADEITEKLRESEKALKLLEPRVPKDLTLKRHPPSRPKGIEVKIAELKKRHIEQRMGETNDALSLREKL